MLWSIAKIVNTGSNIAAVTDPTETICVNIINTNANTKQINPICQFVINKTPNDVATPLPPLNSKNIGYVCPIITAIDVGTTKVCTLTAQVEDEQNVRILGVGIEPTQGIRKGMVI